MFLLVITVYALIIISGENSDVELLLVPVVVIKSPTTVPDGKGNTNLYLLVLSVLPSGSAYEEVVASWSSPLPSTAVPI